MILALLLAQASAVDAERAFAADAQRLGQWTAFRKWAADDAILFWPQPTDAKRVLAPLKDPPRAVEWSPARSYVSCDGTLAANTGPTRWPDGRTGYFSTIWAKQPSGGWKWTVDHGDAHAPRRGALGDKPVVRRASCEGRPRIDPTIETGVNDQGNSRDRTLTWIWQVEDDGSRTVWVALWNGQAFDTVIDDYVAPPPSTP